MTASVRLLFFARYAELLGRDTATIRVALPATVKDVVLRVRQDLPGGAGLPESPMTALNAEHARPDARIADGDELAFLPPLAGG